MVEQTCASRRPHFFGVSGDGGGVSVLELGVVVELGVLELLGVELGVVDELGAEESVLDGVVLGVVELDGVVLMSCDLLRVDLLQPATPMQSANAVKAAAPVSFNFCVFMIFPKVAD